MPGQARESAVRAAHQHAGVGQKIIYHHIPHEVFAGFDCPGAGDLANTFEFNRLYIPNRQADLAECRKLYPAMQSFEAWLRANKAKF